MGGVGKLKEGQGGGWEDCIGRKEGRGREEEGGGPEEGGRRVLTGFQFLNKQQ